MGITQTRAALSADTDQQVRQHLQRHPTARMTANEISRALGRGAGGRNGVVAALRRLADARQVICTEVPSPYGSRAMQLWQVDVIAARSEAP
ncbi:hypothetical protein [Sphaerisporangium aureirubrum]|uniref:MarR family transcriptional regulator n=1 Tax=Sphaerisporangium aureirubrum TaxID=1544736 RepID=A0ABW1ND97_9ACTN